MHSGFSFARHSAYRGLGSSAPFQKRTQITQKAQMNAEWGTALILRPLRPLSILCSLLDPQ